MSVDKFDKELSELYQQSKQQSHAPTVDLTSDAKPVKSTRSPWHMLTLLVTGGAASFGIMALVTHFAKPPAHGTSEQYKQHSVRVVEITEVNPEAVTLPPVTPPLPPKPESNTPKASSEIPTPTTAITKPTFAFNKPTADAVNVPEINQPTFDVKPIHRVMPEIGRASCRERV